jgi:hypothetical protein
VAAAAVAAAAAAVAVAAAAVVLNYLNHFELTYCLELFYWIV